MGSPVNATGTKGGPKKRCRGQGCAHVKRRATLRKDLSSCLRQLSLVAPGYHYGHPGSQVPRKFMYPSRMTRTGRVEPAEHLGGAAAQEFVVVPGILTGQSFETLGLSPFICCSIGPR